MAILAHNHMPISSLIIWLIFLITPPPSLSNMEPVIDPEIKSFIHTICNNTQNPETCESIFTYNLPNPNSGPETLTNVAMDQAMAALYELLGYIEEEKGKICDQGSVNWGILTACERSYLAMNNVLTESKKTFNMGMLKSMVKVGEIFANIHVQADYEIGKCQSMVMNKGFEFELVDFNLMLEIAERNRNIGLLIEMVVVAGEKLVMVMDTGADEKENQFGFMQFLFHG